MSDAGDIRARFDATAAEYDQSRRRLVPHLDEFYGAAVACLDDGRQPLHTVLDLGAGSGLFTDVVLAEHPGARPTLMDVSPDMLELAGHRLADSDPVVIECSLTDPLPDERFDAVVSALAIHHLDDDEKQDLFCRVHARLEPGAVFVNAEQVLGETPTLDRRQRDRWTARARSAGATDHDLEQAAYRMAADRCATVPDQLGWLRNAGFVEVANPWRDGMFAVLSGQRRT